MRPILVRIGQHLRVSKTSENPLYRAIRRDGWCCFEWEVIEECDLSIIDEREIYWINKHDSMSPNGYNLQSGGRTNKVVSEETRQKMSKTRKGRKLSEAHARAISESLKGRTHTAEARRKWGEAQSCDKGGHNTKLNWETVREIRRLRASGATYKELIDKFNICSVWVWKIVKNKVWKEWENGRVLDE
ncbi:grpIintron_endo, group I intron endonuclease [uncultured Caudovirales phage]|uniref:GrpIintron_endo, group I intron endonuclease n=1 Tax=uncultured Caudovirales phage TaxID=2100421 RepID=A0A6J5KK11_9CAUD|nr:grpIintron_endo, group I intron endonuclease [uncultured Caudovirales phage]